MSVGIYPLTARLSIEAYIHEVRTPQVLRSPVDYEAVVEFKDASPQGTIIVGFAITDERAPTVCPGKYVTLRYRRLELTYMVVETVIARDGQVFRNVVPHAVDPIHDSETYYPLVLLDKNTVATVEPLTAQKQ